MNRKIIDFLKKITDRMPAFGITDLAPTIMAIGIAVIIGAVSLLILANLQTQSTINEYCANTALGTFINYGTCAVSTANTLHQPVAYNALQNGTSSISNVFTQLPFLGTVVGLTLVLAVVLYFFYNKGQEGI